MVLVKIENLERKNENVRIKLTESESENFKV